MLYRTFLFILIIINPSLILNAQPGKIRNVRMNVVNNQVKINYDIQGRSQQDSFLVKLRFIDQNANITKPLYTEGDIGMGVQPGYGNTIMWDLTQEYTILNKKLKPKLYALDPQKPRRHMGGPSNAFLSVLLPGLGDYFVADHRDMAFKPYLRTITALGLIATGIYAGNQRYHAEGFYFPVPVKQEIYSGRGGYQIVYEDKYYPGPMQYWLFKGDREVFMTAGIIVWLYDIFWVYSKGVVNRRFLKTMEFALEPTSFPNKAYQLSCRINF